VLGKQRKPLKIKIADDIEADDAIDPKDLRWALCSYCNSVGYLSSFQVGAARLDLTGAKAGIITADEAEHARRKLDEVLARRQPKPKPAASEKRERKAQPQQAAGIGREIGSQPGNTIALAQPGGDEAGHRETGAREQQRSETKTSVQTRPTAPKRDGFSALRAAAARRRESAG
jgi:sRNA-binding protein